MDLNATTALVMSRADAKVFGTGFAVWADESRSYFVTCSHVVRDIRAVAAESAIWVDGVAAEVVADGADKQVDLAVLSVPLLDVPRPGVPLLPLSLVATEGMAIELYGHYIAEKNNPPMMEPQRGRLHRATVFSANAGALKVRSFRLAMDSGDRVHPGYSGGPVLHDGRAIGVTAVQQGQNGSRAIAIGLAALAEIWLGMPSRLLSDAVELQPTSAPTTMEPSVVTEDMAMAWDKDRKKAFRLALQERYRNYDGLKIFVSELGENLPNIVGDRTMVTACFEVVEWAQARGCLSELFEAFASENPNHPLVGGAAAASAKPAKPATSGTLAALQREAREQELDMLKRQYKAVSGRLLMETNPMVIPQLEQQRDEIAAKIAEIDGGL
ncbi:MAG: trypsin-like peptidase domain-containing protein [Geitlerinemataceae cyanobacterium]